MTFEELQPVLSYYHRKLSATSLEFKRYLYSKINWDVRLICIKGARGAGKTTILLQRIKEQYANPESAVYMSLDNLWFKTHSVYEVVEFLYNRGVKDFFFDEVHKYGGWSQLIKDLYDGFPDVRIVYTGSSLLEIDNSNTDLSRRQTVYELWNMSFREYLEYEGVLKTEAIDFSQLLTSHSQIALEITSKIKVLKYFDQYLLHGCYPFYKEAGLDYHTRLAEVATVVMENDMTAAMNISRETVEKMKKLIMIIAQSVPFVPNISKLCESLSCTRDTCLAMLYDLDRAQLLNILTVQLKSYKKLVSPEKILLGNTNYMYALNGNTVTGTIRETFFANQLAVSHSIQIPKKGDFLISEKYLFEVGGADKTFNQIADIPNSYIAYDNVECGFGNKIPLWMFGLLY